MLPFVLNILGHAEYTLNCMYGAISQIYVGDQFSWFSWSLDDIQQILNYRDFNLSVSDVYNPFCTWTYFMSVEIGIYMAWPWCGIFFASNGLKAKFFTIRIIVDGTECPPRNPNCQKHNNLHTTGIKIVIQWKCLVGITLGGLCSYVSPAYVCSTSDRQIMERSTMPHHCDRDDSVMGYKKFDL